MRLIADALAVQEAGAFAVVLELVPAELARAITERLWTSRRSASAPGRGTRARSRSSPTSSGLTQGFTPRHARRFGEVGERVRRPSRPTVTRSSSGTFPGEAESTTMDEERPDEVLGAVGARPAGARAPCPLDAALTLDRDL